MSSDPCGKATASPFRITSGPFRSRIIGPSPSIPVKHGFIYRFYTRNFTKNARSHRSKREQPIFLFTRHKGIKNITIEWKPRKQGFAEFYFNHTPISRSSDRRHTWDAQVQAPKLPVVQFSEPNLFLMPRDVRETILSRHLKLDSVPLFKIPGADHILAQTLKRCSASRIKPNETSELAKKRQNILLFQGVKTYFVLGCENTLCVGVCRRKNFFRLSPSYVQSPKNRENSLCPTVL